MAGKRKASPVKRLRFECPLCLHKGPFINSTLIRNNRSVEACQGCGVLLVFAMEPYHLWRKRARVKKGR